MSVNRMFTRRALHRSCSVPQTSPRPSDRRGAMMMLILIMLIGFVITVVLSVDNARTQLCRTELRSATEAASRAALIEWTRSHDMDLALGQGVEIARLNQVGGNPLELTDTSFQFGQGVINREGRVEFHPHQSPSNAVRVTSRRIPVSWFESISTVIGGRRGANRSDASFATTAVLLPRETIFVVDLGEAMDDDTIEFLKQAIGNCVDSMQSLSISERVGLVSCGEITNDNPPSTLDQTSFTGAVGKLERSGRSDLGSGLQKAALMLDQSPRNRFTERTLIVLIGDETDLAEDLVEVCKTIAQRGIKIHTVSYGPDEPASPLTQISNIGGGKHYHTRNASELADAYRELAVSIGTTITE